WRARDPPGPALGTQAYKTRRPRHPDRQLPGHPPATHAPGFPTTAREYPAPPSPCLAAWDPNATHPLTSRLADLDAQGKGPSRMRLESPLALAHASSRGGFYGSPPQMSR